MNSPSLFLAGAGTGLLAGGTSCAAVQVGLLAGAIRTGERAVQPVGIFLAGKLVVHAALGALLGLAGAAVQPGPRVRAALLGGAAIMLAYFAIRLLRRPTETGTCHPAPTTRTPAVLGAATVLVPCGLTLSAELLAVTSRSALGGMAVMTGFVLGTVPLFGLIGVGLGHGMALLRGRLTSLVGIALLAVAGWTLLSGLRLGGWLPQSSPAASASASARFVRTDPAGTQVITIYALDGGYRPAELAAKAGVHTVLALQTKQNTGCTRDFVIASRGIERLLPASGVTRIDLGVPKAGTLRYTCALGHYFGSVSFRGSSPAAR